MIRWNRRPSAPADQPIQFILTSNLPMNFVVLIITGFLYFTCSDSTALSKQNDAESSAEYVDSFEEVVGGDVYMNSRETANLLDKVRQSKCGRLLNRRMVKGHRIFMLGQPEYPATLAISLEQKTDIFLLQFLNDWCFSEDETIKHIKSHSSLLFLLDQDTPKKNVCGEYRNMSSIEPALIELQLILRFDVVMMFGTGGIKLRYAQQKHGLGEPLAMKYQQSHPSMGTGYIELCAGYVGGTRSSPDDLIIREFEWSRAVKSHSDAMVRQLNALLIQVSCCYEEPDLSHMYDENRRSIVETMLLRTTGIHYESAEATIVVNDGGMPYVRTRPNAKAFIALPPGTRKIDIYHTDGRLITDFNVTLTTNHTFERIRLTADGTFI